MDRNKIKKYEDPVIEDLVLDITDYASVMKTESAARKSVDDPKS